MVTVRGLVDEIAPELPRLTNDQKRRLEAEHDRLQAEWDLLNKKLIQLRRERAIVTDPSTKFQLEQQIQAEEAQLSQVAAELSKIEQTLSQ